MRRNRKKEWANLQARLRNLKKKGVTFRAEDVYKMQSLSPAKMYEMRGDKLFAKGVIHADRVKGGIPYDEWKKAEKKIQELNRVAVKHGGNVLNIMGYLPGVAGSKTGAEVLKNISRSYRTRTSTWYMQRDKIMVDNALEALKGLDEQRLVKELIKEKGLNYVATRMREELRYNSSFENILFDSNQERVGTSGGLERYMLCLGFHRINGEWLHETHATKKQVGLIKKNRERFRGNVS